MNEKKLFGQDSTASEGFFCHFGNSFFNNWKENNKNIPKLLLQ